MKFTTGLSLLSGALALAQPHATAPHKVSLSRGSSLTHSDGRANIPQILASINATLERFQAIKPFPHDEAVALQHAEKTARRRNRKPHRPANLPLTDDPGMLGELGYYGPVTIGSLDGNAQTFQLTFDTGSPSIWVPGLVCSSLEGCPHPTKYDEGGTDLKKTSSWRYLKGSVSGAWYSDDVTIAGLSSSNQSILSVDSAAGFDGPAEGVVGMSFSNTANRDSATFFENLIASGAVQEDEFSFYLGRMASGTANDSELTLGGRDSTKHTGSFTTVPVISEWAWIVAVDNVAVNGHGAGPHTTGSAFIDTGSSIINAPSAAAMEIMAQIPGSFPLPADNTTEDLGMFLYPCDTPDSYMPSFTLAGVSFQVNPLDFNLGNFDTLSRHDESGSLAADIAAETGLPDYCLAALMISDVMNAYILGDTFLKNWYTVFSYSANDGKPAVLFAPSIGNDST